MDVGPAGTYPRELEAEIALRDGSTVHVRPIRSDDAEAFRAFLDTVCRGIDRLSVLRRDQPRLG